MRAKHASFLTSAADAGGFPPQEFPEVAFAGRSNVGKSSLLNTLAGIQKLAKTSNTPGRTRLVNWFNVEDPQGNEIAFVDLPGYGYAKVSRSMRDAWRPLIESYLNQRDVLRVVVVLIDVRRGVEQYEVDLLAWLKECGQSAIVVLTKADKLSKSKRKPIAMAVKKQLALKRPPILFSAQTRDGTTELWKQILQHL